MKYIISTLNELKIKIKLIKSLQDLDRKQFLMQDQNNSHELNGYKFSFNRVNPYIIEAIPQNLSQNIHQKKSTKPKIADIYVQTKKDQLNSSYKLASIKQKTETTPTNNIIKNTKQLFYGKLNENQKNKMLIDLYLRKTKFSKMKFLDRKTDRTQIKLKLNQSANLNLDAPDTVYPKKLSSTNHGQLQNSQTQKKYLSMQNQFQPQSCPEIQQIDQNEMRNESENIKFESPKNNFKKSTNIKLIRNFSENKFNAYLTSPKQKLKLKIPTSGTAPIQKIQKPDHSITSFKTDENFKIKSKKKFHLQINTERSQNNYDFNSQSSELIKIQSVKNNQETIRGNMGALKYKSPRVMLTCRNPKFGSRKQVPKIRLFTEQEEKNIIEGFYNQQKLLES